MASAETANLWVKLNLKDGLTRGIKDATRTLGNFDKGAGRVGKGVGQVGLGFARAGAIIAGAAVTGITLATKAAIDFEDAFAGVRKTVDAPESDLQALALQFRAMATEIPIAATELARIGELGGAMGIDVKDLDEFTRTVALLGVTTDVSVDDAAMALGQLGNILGLTADDFDNFGSTLVDLGNKGESTESAILEITRRAGSGARLIDLAADATIGWSAAVANLGDNPELAGTALQIFFQKSLEAVSGGGKDLKLLASTAGMTGKAFKQAFAKDSSGALQSFIAGLAKLPKDQRLAVVQEVFGKRTGLTRTILGLADSYETNLVPALNDAGKAWDENSALAEEARKRFTTVSSSIGLLKNNLIEAAMVLGEGVAPAIGRAATKLAEFLRQGENRAMLKSLGEDIGKAIDNVNWGRLLDTAKGLASALQPALALVVSLGGLIANLPPGLLGAGAGLVVTNQLSGGLLGTGLGNIFGGLGEVLSKSILSRLPVIGPGFVQPVFVTNMGPGGMPGGGGVPTGKPTGGVGGAIRTAAKVAIPLGVLVAGIEATGINAPGRTIVPGTGNVARQSEADATVAGKLATIDASLKALTGRTDTNAQRLRAQLEAARARLLAPNNAGAQEENRRSRSLAISGAANLGARIQTLQQRLEVATVNGQTKLAERLRAKLDELKMKQQATTQRMSETSAKLSTANARLAAIQRKKTSFTSVTNVNIPITIRDIQNVQNKRRRIVKRNQLATI